MNLLLKRSAVIVLSSTLLLFALGQVKVHANEGELGGDANTEVVKKALSKERKEYLKHMVKQDCGSCHGMTLKGGLGPELLPETLKDKPVLFLQNTILYGRPGTAMPPWKTILTEQEALWISQQLQQGIDHD